MPLGIDLNKLVVAFLSSILPLKGGFFLIEAGDLEFDGDEDLEESLIILSKVSLNK